MNQKDIRWKQRFQNFERMFKLLKKTVEIKNPSEAERAGLVQFFEMNFELSWNLLKDYLESQGHLIKFPREVLKQALQDGLIKDGHHWLEALEARNQTSHLYDEKKALIIDKKIRKVFFKLIEDLYKFFKTK